MLLVIVRKAIPGKKICFNLDIVQGGGSNPNPNCSRHYLKKEALFCQKFLVGVQEPRGGGSRQFWQYLNRSRFFFTGLLPLLRLSLYWLPFCGCFVVVFVTVIINIYFFLSLSDKKSAFCTARKPKNTNELIFKNIYIYIYMAYKTRKISYC